MGNISCVGVRGIYGRVYEVYNNICYVHPLFRILGFNYLFICLFVGS